MKFWTREFKKKFESEFELFTRIEKNQTMFIFIYILELELENINIYKYT